MEQTVSYRDGNNLRRVNYKYEIVNEKSTFVICGYYWGKDNINKNNKDSMTYGQLADRLINYCKKNKCNYFLAEIPEFAKPGGYQIAINFKPTFILETLPIIYPRKAAVIDTDMTVRKYPSLFDMDYDFMGFNWMYEPHQIYPNLDMDCFDPYMIHTSGGMLVFNQTKYSVRLLEEWQKITIENPGKAEDRTISIAFNKNFMLNEMRCLWLPITYFYIPYFYEVNDIYDIPKKLRKSFKHIKNFDEEHSFGDFFNIKLSRDIFIHHPEQLTSEEQAALQGADSDRVPIEFYIENGKKLKCFNNEKGLINIPELYCSTKSDIKSFYHTNKLLEIDGFAKLYDKKLKEPKSRRKYEEIIKSKNSKDREYLVVFSNVLESDIKDNIKDIKHIKNTILINRPKDCSISFVIYSMMKKYKKNILFIENNYLSQNNIDKIINQVYDYDFSCVNTNKYPVYTSSYSKKCDDSRSLFVLSTDLLYFSNNKWGKNLLKLWDIENANKKMESRYTLSRAYNRYMYAIYSRSKWLDPMFFLPSNNIFSREFIKEIQKVNELIYFPKSVVKKFNDKINLYDFFIQCANRRSLLKGYGNPYSVHFKSGLWKK